MTFFKWSQTAASNATADSTINWAEGQAPASVNDSARATMAGLAKYRDDTAGIITTSGTSTAYTVSSYQVFDTLAHLGNAKIAFVPHATNGATVTLNVDSLGAKPLRSAPSVELPAGVLIQGTPYVATYNASDAAFYLQGFYVNPYQLPIGGAIPYLGSTAPNSSFVLPYGQAISRTTYSTLFSLVSTTFGSGDGSTTFNLPDIRGRTIYGLDNMGGSAALRLTSSYFGASVAIGAVGGSESHTMIVNEMPSHTHTQNSHSHGLSTILTSGTSGNTQSGSGSPTLAVSVSGANSTDAATAVNQNTGGGAAFAIEIGRAHV